MGSAATLDTFSSIFPPSCGEKFSTKEQLKEHKKIHRTCPECLLELPHMKGLQSHMKEAHGQASYAQHLQNTSKNHLCQICGRVFPYANTLRQHHLRRHPKEPPEAAECEKCGKKVKDAFHLKNHMKIHTTERKKICPTCGKAFKTATNLHQHKQQHLPRKFICGCGHAFTYRHGLKNHQERCFAGLPCKRPHTKNRPQKDEFGRILPPQIVSSQNRSSDDSSHSSDVTSCPVPPPPPPPSLPPPPLNPSTLTRSFENHNSFYVAPPFLPPPPSMPPLMLPPFPPPDIPSRIFPPDVPPRYAPL